MKKKLSIVIVSSFILLGIYSGGKYFFRRHFSDRLPAEPANLQFFELHQNQIFNQEISANQIHRWGVHLNAEDFLQLSVISSGIDLTGEMISATEAGIFEPAKIQPDFPSIYFIADRTAAFQLELRISERRNGSGKYAIKIDVIRPATKADRDRVIALKVFNQGKKFQEEWKQASFLSGIKKFDEARLYWAQAADREGEAIALKAIGDVYSSFGDYRQALKNYQDSQRTLEQVPQSDSSLIQSAIGLTSLLLGKKDEARQSCLRALDVSRVTKNRRAEAQALTYLGEFQAWASNPSEALDCFTQALSIWREIRDRRGEAQALLFLGDLKSDGSEAQEALDSYQQALPLWRAVNDQRGLAFTLTDVGEIYFKLGQKREALKWYEEARPYFQAMGDKHGEARVRAGLGNLYDEFGEKQKALDEYQQAATLFKSLRHVRGEAANLSIIGSIYQSLGEYTKALNYAQRSLSMIRSIKDKRLESYLLGDIGRIFESSGNQHLALRYYKKELQLSREVNDPRQTASTYKELGRMYQKLGARQTSRAHYERALQLHRDVRDIFGESLTRYHLASLEAENFNNREAANQIEEAVKIIESLRMETISQDLRTSYFSSIHQMYELYIDILMQRYRECPFDGFAEMALGLTEKARARSLLDLLAEAQLAIRQGVDQQLLQQEKIIIQKLSAKAEQRRQQPLEKNEQTIALDQELEALNLQWHEIQAKIKNGSPRYSLLTQPQTLRAGEIQSLLDPETILLEFSLGDRHSYLWAVTKDGIQTIVLPKREIIEKLTRQVYQKIIDLQPTNNSKNKKNGVQENQSRSEYWSLAAQLSRLLLGQLTLDWQQKRLLIVAEGALQFLPFAVLPGPHESSVVGKPLILNHEISYLPSASVLSILRSEKKEQYADFRSIAFLIDPVFEKDDPRYLEKIGAAATALHQSNINRVQSGDPRYESQYFPRLQALADEIDELKKMPGNFLIKRGFEVNRNLLEGSELNRYGVIHFATHGLIDTTHPDFSSIVLSRFDAQGQELQGAGFLHLSEIYNLDLHKQLIVLSACETAIGKDVRGEGLMALTRGFMYAGAQRVIASLWKVEENATTELMKNFYRKILGENKKIPAALREAQLEMWKKNPEKIPYEWGAFILQGEYQ